MVKRKGNTKSNIPFLPKRLDYALQRIKSNHSRICERMKYEYPDQAVTYRTLARNIKNGEIDKQTLDIICKITDVSPDYLTDADNYSLSNNLDFIISSCKALGLDCNNVPTNKYDPEGIYFGSYRQYSLNNNVFEKTKYLRKYIEIYLQEHHDLIPENDQKDFIYDAIPQIMTKVEDEINEAIWKYLNDPQAWKDGHSLI